MKTNSESQSKRVKNGVAVELEVHNALDQLIEDLNLDQFYILEREQILTINSIYGQLTSTPDHVIRIRDTKEIIFAAGTKASLRDRRLQDYYNARVFKDGFPTIPWYEFTRSYKPSLWDELKIETQCQKDLKQAGKLWDGIASVRVPKTMKKILTDIGIYLQAAKEKL